MNAAKIPEPETPVATPGGLWNRLRMDPVRGLTIALVIGVVLYLTLVPLIFLLLASLKPTGLPRDPGVTLSHYLSVYGDPRTFRLLKNSLIFGAGTTAFAMFLGLGLAWILERTDTPGRHWLRLLILVPMATPPLILAMSWVLLLSPRIGFFNNILMAMFGLDAAPLNVYSMSGMIFVQGLAFAPIAFLMISPAFRNMDPALEDAAMASGASLWETMRRVVLPLIAPALGATAAYMFVASLVVFDIPGILGLPNRILVFSSEIFMATNPAAGLPRYGEVSSLSVLFLVILVLASTLYFRLLRRSHRFVTVTGKGFRPRLIRLGPWRFVTLSFVLAYLFMAVIAPLAILAWSSLLPYYASVSAEALELLNVKNFLALFQHPRVNMAFTNTAIVVLVAATGVTFLSALISWIIVRIGGWSARVLDTLSFVPLAVPNMLLGLALIFVYVSLRFLPVYGTIWILVIAYLTQYMSFGTRAANGAYLQIHRELEEAAQVSGASWFQTFRSVLLPLIAPALIGVWVWVAAHAMRELSAALVLAGGQNVVLSTLVWGFWESGQMTRASALGVVLTVALVVLIGLANLLMPRDRTASWMS